MWWDDEQFTSATAGEDPYFVHVEQRMETTLDFDDPDAE